MDQREFIQRRGGPVRRPSRHKRPPRLLWVILALVIVAVIVIVVVKLVRRPKDPGEANSISPPVSGPASSLESAPAESAAETPTPEPVTASQTAPASPPEDRGGFLTADGVGYESYKFDEETTNNYILAVNDAANALPSGVTLYDMIVPTSMDVLLPESYLTENNVSSSDQRKAIDSYIYPSITAMNAGVKTVPLFSALLQHCSEPIYYRTDRTWTQLGGYYAYVEFCKAKGLQATALDQFTKTEYSGFLGGFYTSSQDYNMQAAPDTVAAYTTDANTSLTFTDQNGAISENWSVISDGIGYDSSYLYLIFAAGDQPYKVLNNADLSDGSACVVVQDSFGNYFIPFLTQHYQNVYVVDYRFYSGSVPQLASDMGATDVILLSSVTATSDSTSVNAIASLF